MQPVIPNEKPNLNAKVREVPHKPGVYLMRDRLSRVIYVGKARDLRKRVGSYFMPSRKMRADIKTRALLDGIWDFEIHVVKSEPEALLLEGRLIKEYRPKYNVVFRDDKRFLLVKVDPREEWPRFRLTRLRKPDGARYFGPFAYPTALRQTLNFMRKKFGVLTFGSGSPTARELKSSTYQVPMRLREITVSEYQNRVESACGFLSGGSAELLTELETQMQKAAAKLDFEKAAELRNMIEDLRETTKPMRRFTRYSLPTTIDPTADIAALRDALQLADIPKIMECFDISNISTTHIVASMVCFRNGVPDKANYRRYRVKTVSGQDDFASMAEVVRRRYSRVLLEAKDVNLANGDLLAESQETPQEQLARIQKLANDEAEENDELSENELSAENRSPLAKSATPKSKSFAAVRLPDLIIVDGGKGQLSSACRELQRLGLYELPIIGLAKEFEEIYRPARPVPLRLPEDSGALRLLQRIRDEAHRFANGYHQLLMKRRMAESVLDEIPGVSANRKQLLLQRFGSVARLRKTSVEKIAETEGIGSRLAEQIVKFLEQHH